LSEHPRRGLGDGGASAQQQAGGVGDRDVPVLVLVLGLGEIQYPSILLHDSALFEVINIRPLRVQNGFEVGELLQN